MLQRAMASVAAQRLLPDGIIVAYDLDEQGSAATRQRAMMQVNTEWIAFLDDDDELLPQHLKVLKQEADVHKADIVWSWYRVKGGRDPIPRHRGRQWNPNSPHLFPITSLVRTELAQQCSFIPNGEPTKKRNVSGDDRRLHRQLSNLGAKFHHTAQITWHWHHHGENTSGLPDSPKLPGSGQRRRRRRK